MKKYQHAYNWIKEKLLPDLYPNAILPTEKELCETLSLSKTTIRKAISVLKAERIVKTVQGKGTVFTPGGNTKINETIKKVGVVCFFLDSYIFPSILSGIEHTLSKKGDQSIVQQSQYLLEKEKEAVEALLNQDVISLIIEPIITADGDSNIQLYKQVMKEIPIIFLDNTLPSLDVHALLNDDMAAGRLAAKNVYEYGHREVGFLYQEEYTPKYNRISAAREWLSKQNVHCSKSNVIVVHGQEHNSDIEEKIHEYFQDNKEYPSVFICSNDSEAVAFMKIASQYNIRIPEDISLVGFDNSKLGESVFPGLTSVTHPKNEMGALAAQLAQFLQENKNVYCNPFAVTYTPKIIIRKSLMRRE